MTSTHPTRRRLATAAAVSTLALAGLAGCSSSSSSSDSSASASATGCPVTMAEPWVKAADKGMTAAFGTLTNTSGAEVTITAASTPASQSTELHEVVDDNGKMIMQPVAGGFQVPADGTLSLEPGGFHIMLMDVTKPIEAGQEVSFTLTCADGATTEFTAQARNYTGADEEYKKDGMTDMDSMSPSPSMS